MKWKFWEKWTKPEKEQPFKGFLVAPIPEPEIDGVTKHREFIQHRWSKMYKASLKGKKSKLSEFVNIGAAYKEPPLLHSVENLRGIIFNISYPVNKHFGYDTMYQVDPEVRGAIDTISMMTRRVYAGLGLKMGEKEEETEKKFLEEARDFAKKIDVPLIYETAARDMLRHGDHISKVLIDGNITGLQTWPISRTTIVENAAQIGHFDVEIMNKNIYVLNEQYTGAQIVEGRQTFKPDKATTDKIFHCSLMSNSEVIDIVDRWTFGVWSISPLESCRQIILWKLNMQLDDMKWRHYAVPRPVFSLKVEAFNPEFYDGTPTQRRTAALADMQTALDDFEKKIRWKETEQGWVISDNVVPSYLEPKMKYTDPNPMLENLNRSIYNSLFNPEVAMATRESQAFAAATFPNSYMLMRASVLADIISKEVIKLIESHFRLANYQGYQELMKKLEIKHQLILDKDRAELARIAAVLIETGDFTPTEIRELFNKEPLTDDQKKEILEWAKKIQEHKHTSTTREIQADRGQRATQDPGTELPTYERTQRQGQRSARE